MTRFSKNALQAKVQKNDFERGSERVDNKRAISVLPAPICACALTNCFRYAKKDKSYSQYAKGLLANPRLLNFEFQQSDMYTEKHLIRSSGITLVGARKNSVSEQLYASYRKIEFASSVKLEYN